VTSPTGSEERVDRALQRLARVFGPDQVAALVEYEDAMIESRAQTVQVAAPVSEWMTVPEAAEELRCTKQHVYDMRSDGRLTKFNEGGPRSRALCKRSEVAALVNRNGR
jgi:excisionase family DNA binding protein